jgi:iron complex outermembrane receptor protein
MRISAARGTQPLVSLLGACASIVAVTMIASAALAQTTQVAGTSTQSAGNTGAANAASTDLDVILVTARRKEEDVQKVPIAITVVSPQALADNNVVTLEDLQSLVPSMTVSSSNTGSKDTANVSIRGQGWGSIGGTPAVAMYLNEMPVVTNGAGLLAGGPGLLFDLENVQVLKGPQGTLFGRNTMGGAILLQTAMPGDEFGGHVQAGVGNYNEREWDAAVNLPIVSDVLLARLAVNGQVRDGYTHYISEPGYPNGIDLDNRNYTSVRGTLLFRPNSMFSNESILTYQDYRNNGSSDFLVGVNPNDQGGLIVQKYPTLLAQLAEQEALGARVHIPSGVNTSANGGELLAFTNITRIALTDNLTFRNILGDQTSQSSFASGASGSSSPIFNIYLQQDPEAQYSEEAQLQGKSFASRLDWQAGVFFLKSNSPSYQLTELDVLATSPGDPSDPNVNARGGRFAKNEAVYAQGTFDLSDWIRGLKFTGGLRENWDWNQGTSVGANPADPTPSWCGGVDPTNCSFVTYQHPNHSRALTWTTGFDYAITSEQLVYLQSRRGYRPGGSVVDQSTIGPLTFPFQPEYVTDYELGLKSNWTVGSIPIKTDVDFFDQEYTSIQVTEEVPVPGGQPGEQADVTGNAAAARLQGAEFEGTAQLTSQLSVRAYWDYLSFHYRSFGAGVASDALVAGETANRIPHKYGLGGAYKIPLAHDLGNVRFNADYAWQARFGDFLGTDIIPAHDTLNVSANWDNIAGAPVDLSFFMSNALNKTYLTGGIGFGLGFVEGTYGDPRMFGARLNYRFGAH